MKALCKKQTTQKWRTSSFPRLGTNSV